MTTFSVITPTGDRPQALDLCARWIDRQTFRGFGEWIVIDDGEGPHVPQLKNRSWVVKHIRREPSDAPSVGSFAMNLMRSVEYVEGDLVTFFEDDDWYAPHHLAELEWRLKESDAVGHEIQRYYHLPSRSWFQCTNRGSSLCQTGLRRKWLKVFMSACKDAREANSIGVDFKFWQYIRARSLGTSCDLYRDGLSMIGMKGLPGRAGLGMGHRPEGSAWTDDPELEQLGEWIGEDVGIYRGIAKCPA